MGMIEGVKHNVCNEVAMQSIEAHNDTPPTAVLQKVLINAKENEGAEGRHCRRRTHMYRTLPIFGSHGLSFFGAKTTPRPPRIVSFTIEKQ